MIYALQIVSDVHNYTTRQKHLLHVNKNNINIYSKSFVNTSARIWNAMQSEIEENVSISIFKMSSKMYLQEHTLYFKYSKWDYCILYNVFGTDSLPHYDCLNFIFYLFIYHYHFILLMCVVPFKYTKDAYNINYNIFP